MKYLKKFLESSSGLYYEIGSNEWRRLYREKENMEDVIFDKVNRLFSNCRVISYRPDGKLMEIKILNNGSISILYPNGFEDLIINMITDEWFLVSINMSKRYYYYKCDQIDGLIALLTNSDITGIITNYDDVIVSFQLAQILRRKRFHIATNLFYTEVGKLSSDVYYELYRKRKMPRADWNAYPENPNAKPWYRGGYSAPTIGVVKKWIEKRTGKITKNEEEIKKALELL